MPEKILKKVIPIVLFRTWRVKIHSGCIRKITNTGLPFHRQVPDRAVPDLAELVNVHPLHGID